MKEVYVMKGILARWRTAGVILALAAFSLLLLSAACAPAAQDDTTGPTDTTETTEHQDDDEHDEDAVASGQILYAEKGCAACHGADGEGTELAPAMAGHSETQVLRQVRAPVGIMPPFSPEAISDDELTKIAEYVTSLGGGHMHEMAPSGGDENIQHHWMALSAMEDGTVAEAEHHLSHIIELTEGPHRDQMNIALTALRAGDIHDAEHAVENMLAGVAQADLTFDTMHLKMALSALTIDQASEATHHLEHALTAADHDTEQAIEAIQALIAADDHETADHELRELLGDEAPAGDAHDEGEDAHTDDADAHAEGEDAHTDDADAHAEDEDAHTDDADAHAEDEDAPAEGEEHVDDGHAH